MIVADYSFRVHDVPDRTRVNRCYCAIQKGMAYVLRPAYYGSLNSQRVKQIWQARISAQINVAQRTLLVQYFNIKLRVPTVPSPSPNKCVPGESIQPQGDSGYKCWYR